MTKKEMKELVSSWNKEIGEKRFKRQKEIYNELMDLNQKYGDGHRYASVNMNMYGLLGTRYECRAERLLREHDEIEGQWKALMRFQEITNNFNL